MKTKKSKMVNQTSSHQKDKEKKKDPKLWKPKKRVE